jgi:hypothetical protein
MGVDVEGARVGYRAGADRDGAAWDTERHGTRCRHGTGSGTGPHVKSRIGVWCGRRDASLCPVIWALAFLHN